MNVLISGLSRLLNTQIFFGVYRKLQGDVAATWNVRQWDTRRYSNRSPTDWRQPANANAKANRNASFKWWKMEKGCWAVWFPLWTLLFILCECGSAWKVSDPFVRNILIKWTELSPVGWGNEGCVGWSDGWVRRQINQFLPNAVKMQCSIK